MTSLGAPGKPSGTLFRLMPTGTGPEQSVRPAWQGNASHECCWLGRFHTLSGPALAFLLAAFLNAPAIVAYPGERWPEWPKDRNGSQNLS